jgi:exopolysaccharide biosynthesis polyprenyl glycosylphosphotransferase
MAIAETSPADPTAVLLPEPGPIGTLTPRVAGDTLAGRLLGERGFVACCLAADVVGLIVALAVALGPSAVASTASATVVVCTLIALAWRGLYDADSRRSALDLIGPVSGAVIVAALAAVVLTEEWSAASTNDGPATAAALTIVAILIGRGVLMMLRRRVRTRGALARPTLILGAGEVGVRIAERLLAQPGLGLRPVGFVDGPGERSPATTGAALPVLGSHEQLPALAAATGARELIVAFPAGTRDAELRPAVASCERLGMRVSVVPRLFESVNGRLAYEPLGGLPLMGLRSVDPDGWRFAVKHAFDLVVAVCALVVLAPLLLAIAAAVRLESPGPVLFRQRRVGRDGQVFDLLKFRSMRQPAGCADFTPRRGCAPGGVEGDDRRTRMGRLLRRTSLDELPQLVNVVCGEMSLVGPRPERPEFVAMFVQDVRRYGDRERVRSGLTGWAQVNGLRGQTSLAERIEYDNFYIEHWSLGLDLKIMLRTVAAVLRSVED